MSSEEMNRLIRAPKPVYALASNGAGHAKFVVLETTEPETDGNTEPRRVVDGGADGGKGREQQPEPRAKDMNSIIRQEAFIDDARRLRQRGW